MTRPDLDRMAAFIDAAVAAGLDPWTALCDAATDPPRCSCAAGGMARICEPDAKICEQFASHRPPTTPPNPHKLGEVAS